MADEQKILDAISRNTISYLKSYRDYRTFSPVDQARERSRLIKEETGFLTNNIDHSAFLHVIEYLDSHPHAREQCARILRQAERDEKVLTMFGDGRAETRGQHEERLARETFLEEGNILGGNSIGAIIQGAYNEYYGDFEVALQKAAPLVTASEIVMGVGEAVEQRGELAEKLSDAARGLEKDHRAHASIPGIADWKTGDNRPAPTEGLGSPRPDGNIMDPGPAQSGASGLPSFVLETRAFVPFENFGNVNLSADNFADLTTRPYQGDNRGFSTAADASSRIHSTVTLQPATASYSNPDVWSDKTSGPYLMVLPDRQGNSPSKMDVQATRIGAGASYQVHSFGSNPLVAGSPDIDFHANVVITQPSSRMARIEVELKGDKFPAYEAVLRDKAGNGIFLGGFMPTSKGNLWTHLFGDAQRPMGKLTVMVSLDAAGNFNRVISAQFSGPYSTLQPVLDKNTSFTPAGWSRALMSALTPDKMPQPQLPKIDSPKQISQPAPVRTPERHRGGMER